jgi:tetratricopeptide (TPR) repeat protein
MILPGREITRSSPRQNGGSRPLRGNAGILFALVVFFIAYLSAHSSCASFAASAEEYYTIGMAYFELGQFEEAERWLNRARAADRTKVASEYNLGRIAFETGRYKDAAVIFDRILDRDPQNTMALKAAAYTRIKTGELTKAEEYYQRVLALIPESVDDGYNYALVLFAMEKFEDAEKILLNNPYALEENKDALLLYARTQRAQDKVEAVDTYAKFLLDNQDPQVRYEYAQVLEDGELYAKAIEEYRTTLSELSLDAPGTPATPELKPQDVRFSLARVLLIADGENPEGLTELEGAISDGFADAEALENLALDERISPDNQDRIRAAVNRIEEPPAPAEPETETPDGESGEAGEEALPETGSETGISEPRE